MAVSLVNDINAARAAAERGRRKNWWRRLGTPKSGFRYVAADGSLIKDQACLDRIASLVVPPAWRWVRISPAASSRVQAVGVDTSGRLQYIYESKFAARQQRQKFAKIEEFGRHLPRFREATNRDLSLDGLPKEKVLAVMTRLINSLYVRVGSEKSVKQYKTYGITTLKNKHLTILRGGRLVFEFVGKSHVQHRTVLTDKELAEIMAELKKIGPARKLFHYINGDGKPHGIKPSDVNRYIKSITDDRFTSKDFRIWGATLTAAVELAEIGACEDERERKRNLVKAVKRTSEQLGNTPTVCRTSYIHPAVIKAYESGVILDAFRPKTTRRRRTRLELDLEPEEAALLKLLEAARGGK